MSAEIQLKCTVSKGMFSDERVVELRRSGQESKMYVVPASDVADVDKSGNGKLRASVVSRGNKKWVVLPTNRRDTIPFDENALVSK